jgi:hypothetical protein
MGILNKLKRNEPPAPRNGDFTPSGAQSPASAELEKANVDTHSPVKLFTPRIFSMIMVVSLGGLIFGVGPDLLSRKTHSLTNLVV